MSDVAPDTPSGYAKHLAGYIRDPSTVRARTMEQFGKAPAIERIVYWRSEVERLRAKPYNSYLGERYDATKYGEGVERKIKPRPVVATPETPPVFDLPPWKLGGTDAARLSTPLRARSA